MDYPLISSKIFSVRARVLPMEYLDSSGGPAGIPQMMIPTPSLELQVGHVGASSEPYFYGAGRRSRIWPRSGVVFDYKRPIL